jgi:hypothetical protein
VFFALIPAVCLLGGIIGFFISTGRALRKFNRLDPDARNKLLLVEYYMTVVRNLSKEDLLLLSTLPDEEIKQFNMIHDHAERIQSIRKKISNRSYFAHIATGRQCAAL